MQAATQPSAGPASPGLPGPGSCFPAPTDTRAVVARFQDMVYRIAVTHTQCRGDADDVFQDVFLTYHRRQPDCRDSEHLKAWLITTTVNIARRTATSSWRTRVVPLHPGTGDSAVDATTEPFRFRTELQDAVARAMQVLPDEYRTVLHLFYFDDLPVVTIADLLGLTEGAVKMRLSRGRALMRDQLHEGLFDD
ncbi:MAG: sigma-70 family RNA polymerase sigma factor [Micrococcales bacterium]|nr:sigma-70 family RNA polymerase sigma factor [Micrococcales bacterium]